MKCKVCGKRFRLLAKNKYIALERTGPLEVLTKPAKEFECFDCPVCGCQNIVNIREDNIIESEVE